MLPKHSFFLKYVKSKHRVEIEPEILKIFCGHFELGKSEVYGYINYLKQNNSEELTNILKMYGVKDSDIESFQKKIRK